MAERLTRQEQQERTRDQLVDAAMELFAEHGIANVSMDRIAASIGRTKGAVYANFADKDELIAAVMERHMFVDYSDLPNFGALATDDSRPAAERFAGIGDGYATAVSRRRQFALFLIESWLYAQRNESARPVVSAAFERAVTNWAADEDVRSHLPDGLTGRELARLVLAVDLGVGLQTLLDPERFPPELYGLGLQRLFAPTPESP